MNTTTTDDYVKIRLSEIQRIRDAIARLPERFTNQFLRQLHDQICCLYQDLQKQLRAASQK